MTQFTIPTLLKLTYYDFCNILFYWFSRDSYCFPLILICIFFLLLYLTFVIKRSIPGHSDGTQGWACDLRQTCVLQEFLFRTKERGHFPIRWWNWMDVSPEAARALVPASGQELVWENVTDVERSVEDRCRDSTLFLKNFPTDEVPGAVLILPLRFLFSKNRLILGATQRSVLSTNPPWHQRFQLAFCHLQLRLLPSTGNSGNLWGPSELPTAILRVWRG